MAQRVVLGRIGGAHGVRGWVRVSSHTDPPQALLKYPLWQLCRAGQTEPQAVKLVEGHWDGRQLRAKLEGIADRNAAEALNGCEVLVWRSELPAAADSEYYQVDLLGLRVRNLEGVELGTLSYFVEAPAQTVMVVQGAAEHWIPAAPPHLCKVRMADGEIDVDWPAEL
ncbi:MAG: ribosome maturation factor RimM [Steroidobacteraceae bacterium]